MVYELLVERNRSRSWNLILSKYIARKLTFFLFYIQFLYFSNQEFIFQTLKRAVVEYLKSRTLERLD